MTGHSNPIRFFTAVTLTVALAACNSAAPGPQASAAYAPAPQRATHADLQLPAGTPCSADIQRWQAVQDNDIAAGQVGDSVARQIAGEIAGASAACRAGRDAEARSMVVQSRRSHGYPS